jgi:hypothetical protein
MRWMHDSARSLAESGSRDVSQGSAASILHMSAMGDAAEMWGEGMCHVMLLHRSKNLQFGVGAWFVA